MQRIAHISAGRITNVSVGEDDWTAPQDGSQMLEADAIAANLPYASAEPRVPEQVTMRGMRLALFLAGLETSVEAAIAAVPDETERGVLQRWWDFSPTVERAHPIVAQLAAAVGQTDAQLAAAVGQTDAQVDALFISAQQQDA